MDPTDYFRPNEMMHIAAIDFPEFYRDAFGGNNGAAELVTCVRRISGEDNQAKIVLHQAARMIWLSDRMEQFAKDRAALQILFFLIAAEAVAKLVNDVSEEGRSRQQVRSFFEDICSPNHRKLLERSFSNSKGSGFLTCREVVDFLYKIRCDVVHEGRYSEYTLKQEIPMLTPAGEDEFFIAHITAGQLRQIILEGALIGALRLLPEASHCREFLTVDIDEVNS